MYGSWIVEAAIRYSTNGVRIYEQLGAGATSLGVREAELTGKINAKEAAYLRMYGAQDALARRRADVFSGYSLAVAAAGAVAIGDSVVQAAKLQQTLIAIRNETGANSAAMERFYNTIFKIADIMGTTPTAASDVMLNISRLTAGTLTTAQMQAIAPSIAGFASTIHFNRPDVSVDEASKAGIQLSHLFHAWDPQSLERLLDRVYRLSGLIVESPSAAVRQMSYFEPLFKGLKIDDSTSIAMMALLERAGFRNKVGTNVRAMMLEELGPLQLTKHFQQGQGRILEQMGIFDQKMHFRWNNASGGVDYIGMLEAVAKWAAREERAGVPSSVLAKDVYGALGKSGGNIAQLMLDPKVLAVFADIRKYQGNPAVSLAAGERNRQGSIVFQAERVWGNFQAVMTELGYRAVWVSGTLKGVADDLHRLQQWLHSHRNAEDWIGGLAVGVTALATLGASARVVFPLLRFVGGGLFDIGSGAGKTATTLYRLGSAATAADAGALSATTALGGLVSILGVLAGSAAAFKGIDWWKSQHIDSKYGSGFTKKYEDYLRSIHGPNAGSAPWFDGSMVPAGGGMTEEQFHQHLQHQKPRSSSRPRTVGLSPNHAVIQNHVAKVEVNFPNVKDGPGAAVAMEDLWLNPRSELYTGASIKTHPNLPTPLTIANDG